MNQMLYLSQLLLDGRSPQARRDLSDCHALHQRILSAFPDEPGKGRARERFAVLYRAEMMEGGARILVQSRELPDWSRLPEKYTWKPVAEPKRVDESYARIVTGQDLLFRLRANPTRRINARNADEPERWRGKRVELRREEDQIAWLVRKGEAAGFHLLGARANAGVADLRTTRTAERVYGRSDTRRMTFGSVVFEGRLRVMDAERFRQALAEGIGSGKAFGFGLLSIALAG
jgi:CRISPR system Cascade subunit CasE